MCMGVNMKIILVHFDDLGDLLRCILFMNTQGAMKHVCPPYVVGDFYSLLISYECL